MITFQTNSSKETQKIAGAIAKALPQPLVIAFNGNLGSGKTTFIQGFCGALKVADLVNSPSFTLVNTYQGAIPIQHIDFYRLDSEEEIELLGLDEYLPPTQGFTLIEWASHAPHLLPKDHLTIELIDKGETTREIKILGTTEKTKTLVAALQGTIHENTRH